MKTKTTSKKKTSKKKPIEPTAYLDVVLRTTEEEVKAGDDNDEPFRYRGVNTYTLDDVQVILVEKDMGYPVTFKIDPGEDVFVLIEDCSDGDTFGHTEHTFYSKGVFKTYDEAWEASKKLPLHDSFFGQHNAWRIERAMVNRQ